MTRNNFKFVSKRENYKLCQTATITVILFMPISTFNSLKNNSNPKFGL